MLGESIEASRSLTAELSPPVLHREGLAGGLEWLARWMQERYNLLVAVKTEINVSPSQEDLSVLLFESVKELLFNVVKHAQVQSATVTMERMDKNLLRIVVCDAGRVSTQARLIHSRFLAALVF